MEHQVSVIIVNYKNPHEVDALARACLRDIAVGEVIIVDNSQDMARTSDYRVIPQENIGFAAANNKGSDAAQGTYLAIINPDIIIDKDTISQLLRSHLETKASITAPSLINPDGTYQKNAGWFSRSWKLWQQFVLLPIHMQDAPLKTQRVDWVTGGFILIRKELFESLGKFDEHYFMYFEDLDLCYRAKNVFVTPLRVVHNEHASVVKTTADKHEWYRTSWHYFVKKWRNAFASWLLEQLYF